MIRIDMLKTLVLKRIPSMEPNSTSEIESKHAFTYARSLAWNLCSMMPFFHHQHKNNEFAQGNK